jgi:histidinol-phosphate aminotransferase
LPCRERTPPTCVETPRRRTSFPHTEILKIIHALKDTSIVVLDETYAEFSKQGSLVGELPNHANLIILRTLSKSYALAGQRMGCFLSGDEDFIRFVRSKCLDVYPMPVGPINAALHVMEPLIQKHARKNIKKLLAEKEYLAEGFSKSPLVRHIYPSDANFFLAEMTDAAGFYKYCWDNDIILRDFSTKKLTENCIRISTGTREQNDKLLKLLSQYAAQKAA